jgi:hypothetical protein
MTPSNGRRTSSRGSCTSRPVLAARGMNLRETTRTAGSPRHRHRSDRDAQSECSMSPYLSACVRMPTAAPLNRARDGTGDRRERDRIDGAEDAACILL